MFEKRDAVGKFDRRRGNKVMIGTVGENEMTHSTNSRFVSDTDFRLQLPTILELLGSVAQSPRDRSYFSPFAGKFLRFGIVLQCFY